MVCGRVVCVCLSRLQQTSAQFADAAAQLARAEPQKVAKRDAPQNRSGAVILFCQRSQRLALASTSPALLAFPLDSQPSSRPQIV